MQNFTKLVNTIDESAARDCRDIYIGARCISKTMHHISSNFFHHPEGASL